MSLNNQTQLVLRNHLLNVQDTPCAAWPTHAEDTSYSTHNVFTMAVVVNIETDGSEFFAPNLVVNKLKLAPPTNIEPNISVITPLTVTGSAEKNTFDAVIKLLLQAGNSGDLIKVKTKTTCYYGGGGIIFGEDWTPLIMLGAILTATVDKQGSLKTSYMSPAIYINPRVLEGKDLLSRAFLKKVIPFIITDWRRFRVCATQNSIYPPAPVKMVIEDISHMIITPEAPQVLDYSPEINEFLVKELCQ